MTSQNGYQHHRHGGCPRARHLLVTLVAAVLLLTAGVADAAFTTDKCLVSKRKAWSALRKCQATEEVKKLLGKATDFAKCDTKFHEKVAQIDEKAAKAAIACRYGDNGDGTVTDYDTGLQWEKKTGFSVIGGGGFTCPPGGDVHCVNNTYDWHEAIAFADTSTDFGATLTTCFFGHCDWRLPKITELKTILLEPCGSSPCIDPIFGPTADDAYWSSTADPNPTGNYDDYAWNVLFNDGFVFYGFRGNSYYVRAVRGAF